MERIRAGYATVSPLLLIRLRKAWKVESWFTVALGFARDPGRDARCAHLFLALTDPKDTTVKALRMIRGAQSYAAFKEAIENLLSAQR